MIRKFLLPCIICFSTIVLSIPDMSAQSQEWEFDRIRKRQEEQRRIDDSTLVHLAKRWEIKLNYGSSILGYHQGGNNPVDQNLSGSMANWQLAGVWHFSERFFVDLSIGIQQKRYSPSPDVNSIINGDDIELEGGGLIFIPIDLGLKYYLAQEKFRPYIGLGCGVNIITLRQILIEGNIVDGINTTDSQLSERMPFADVSIGFDYRLGLRTNFTLNTSFITSDQFNAPIGGYQRYGGVLINAGLAIIL